MTAAPARRPAGSSSGFTLLELLVVVVLSAALVALLGLVYRQVQQAGEALTSVESDWQVQMFLRRQLVARDERFDALALTTGESTRLRLVTRYSAAYAMAGPPVLAHYEFEPNQERLVYRETPLPPWWLEGQTPAEFRALALAEASRAQQPRTMLEGVAALRFEYGDGSADGWRDDWSAGPYAEPPALVRIGFARLGSEVVWTMPTALLRFALPVPALGERALEDAIR